MAIPLIVSIGFIVLTCLVAELSRSAVNATVTTPLSRLLFLEFIAAAELCSICFELIIGRDSDRKSRRSNDLAECHLVTDLLSSFNFLSQLNNLNRFIIFPINVIPF